MLGIRLGSNLGKTTPLPCNQIHRSDWLNQLNAAEGSIREGRVILCTSTDRSCGGVQAHPVKSSSV